MAGPDPDTPPRRRLQRPQPVNDRHAHCPPHAGHAANTPNAGGVPDTGDTPAARSVDALNLPKAAVGRLSLYYRELHRLRDAGTASVNSRELGRLVDVSPAVVRRDLSALGAVGRRGVGYSVELLVERLGQLLGSGVQWSVVLVGVGSLGTALLRYRGFARLGFRLVAAFDVDPAKLTVSLGGVRVSPLSELQPTLRRIRPELAILAVPVEAAPDVAAQLAAGGVSGILNFAPTTIKLPGPTAIANVDLASELQRLAFSVQHTRP